MSFAIIGGTGAAISGLSSLAGAFGQEAKKPFGADILDAQAAGQAVRRGIDLDQGFGDKFNEGRARTWNMMKGIRGAELDELMKKRREEYESDPTYGLFKKQFKGEDLADDAGYQFRVAEGAKGVDRSAAARGGVLSGAAMKAMERYRQGFASNEFDRANTRFENYKRGTYNMLSGGQAQALQNQQQMQNQLQQYQADKNAIQQNKWDAIGGVGNMMMGGAGNLQSTGNIFGNK